MKFFNKILDWLDHLLNRLLQGILILVTVVVSWQVFSRYVLNAPSSFTEELARFLLIWLTLLGCVFAYRHNSHLGLDMVYSQSSGAMRKVMYHFIHACVALFAISVMIIGGFLLMKMTEDLGQSSPVMGIDISIIYFVVPLSGVLIFIYAIHAILNPHYDAISHDDFAHGTTFDDIPDNNTKKKD
uniref:TRAP transporter small permease n=1 Tax=Ningiella ruwaisensis TaxID=2364274 RepID=UPI00109F81E6|nr:TRAP transporter small permease [Ningiella ruwaisensis]